MTSKQLDPQLAAGNRQQLAGHKAEHFLWEVKDGVGTVTLNRPERKNPLTFDSYAELRDLFGRLKYATDVHAVVVTGAGGNFCSGGDVHEIIGPLVKLPAPELLMFTRMTGDLVKTMRACPQPIVAALDGVCAGAGAIMAMRATFDPYAGPYQLIFAFDRAGKDLTTDKMVAAIESIQGFRDIFGGPPVSYGPNKHQGADEAFLFQVQKSRFVQIAGPVRYGM